MGNTTLFRPKGAPLPAPGTKAKLTPVGDLLVGSTARTAVGFVLTPFTLLKTISEVRAALLSGRERPLASSADFLPPARAVDPLPPQLLLLPHRKTLDLHGPAHPVRDGRDPLPLARRCPDRPARRTRRGPLHRLLRARAEDHWRCGRRRERCRRRGCRRCVFLAPRPRTQRLTLAPLSLPPGAAASLASTLLTTPFDVLKTRRQLSPQNYTSLLSSAALVYRTSGIRGFWEGGALRVCRKAGSAGIGWAVYEAFVGVGEGRRAVAAGGKDRSGGG